MATSAATHRVQPTNAPPLFGIQAIRGVASLLVVATHLEAWNFNAFPGQTPAPHLFVAGESGVDLIFVVSGFIMMYITPAPFVSWRDQITFLLRRFVRIYPPYWFILVLLILSRRVVPIGGYFGSGADVAANFLLLPTLSYSNNLAVAWTLAYEIFFYVIVSFIFYLIRPTRLAAVAGWASVIVLVSFFGSRNSANAYFDSWLSLLSLEFMAGMLLAVFVRRGNRGISGSLAAIGIIAVVVFAAAVGTWHGPFSPRYQPPLRLLCYGLPAVIIVGTVLKMEMQSQWRWLRRLAPLGDRSYSIYLVHWPLFGFVFTLAASILPQPSAWQMAGVKIAALVLLAVGAELSYRFIELPSHGVGKRIVVHLRG